MAINMKGNFFVAREVAKRLVAHKRPGSIVNVASILGLRPGSRQVHTCLYIHICKSILSIYTYMYKYFARRAQNPRGSNCPRAQSQAF